MSFAKIKITGIGKFECKNMKELDDTIKIIRIKIQGEK
jgi:hypothetical protein